MRPVATDDGVVVVAKGAVATAKVTLAEKAHRKGRGGRLELSFESVEFVDGQKVAIHATASEDGDGGHAMVENMVSAGILTAGLASPLFLFQKGSPVEMQPNIRFVAWLTNDATLARPAVAANQPVPPKERTDVAVVYFIKSAMKGEVTEFRGAPVMTRIVCGDQAYR